MCLSFLFDAQFNAAFDGLDICPRLCSSAGAMLCIYNAWFRLPASGNAHFLKRCFEVPMPLVRSFIRFRTGCHNLPSVSGRYSNVPRHLRKCQKCSSDGICDEYHLVFECPALAGLRVEYSCLFGPHAMTMRQFVWQEDTIKVMKYIQSALTCLTHDEV